MDLLHDLLIDELPRTKLRRVLRELARHSGELADRRDLIEEAMNKIRQAIAGKVSAPADDPDPKAEEEDER